MDLRALQEDFKKWAAKNFGSETGIEPACKAAMGVGEEAGELLHVMLKASQKIRGYDDIRKVDAEGQDAIGDIVIYCLDVCNRMGWDFERVLGETARQVLARDWTVQKAPKPLVLRTKNVPIIGLTGLARSGKDTVGEVLRKHGYARRAFADNLKTAAAIIFGLTDQQLYGSKKEAVDDFWKETPRAILQKLGTECLRNGFDPAVWIQSLRRTMNSTARYVVTDVRYENEARAILSWGGVIWKIHRPGAGAAGGVEGHASEAGIPDALVEWHIKNDGTLEQLEKAVEVAFMHEGPK